MTATLFLDRCHECNAEMAYDFVDVVTCRNCGQRYQTDYEEEDDGDWFCILTPIKAAL